MDDIGFLVASDIRGIHCSFSETPISFHLAVHQRAIFAGRSLFPKQHLRLRNKS